MERRRPSTKALLAACVFVGVAVAATVAWELLGEAVTDIALYRTYGERVADGLVPYRDFAFEYPPGALPALVLPALVTGSLDAYRVVFVAELAAMGAAAVLALDWALRRSGASNRDHTVALAVVAASPLLLGGVILTRFDLLPAALVAAAVGLMAGGRLRASALVTGAGIAVKLYPAVLVPVLAVAAWRRSGRREAAIVVALAIVPVVLVYLPFLVIAPDGVLDSFTRQLGRPLQIESLGSGILLALHHAFGTSLEWASGSGSQNLTGTAADTVAVVQGVAQVAALALVWVGFARGPATTERLVRYAAASVVAFVALSKVLSPQFLVWLVLLVPLIGGASKPPRADLDRRRVRADGGLVPRSLLGARPGVRPARLVARPAPRADARRAPRRAHASGHGTRTGSIALARPVAGSHVTRAPSRRTPPDAVSNRTGIPVRIRRIARSDSTPITESCGPVMPTSVSAAVPPGSTRASAVWTCVCVPSTAVTRPSSQRASATFSLVASAWTSTTTTEVAARASSTRSSTSSHMLWAGSRKREPIRLSDRDARPVSSGDDRRAAPRGREWKVRRTHDRRGGGEVGADLLAPPGVVAERDRVRACGEQPLREPRRDPDPVGDVLSIDNARIDVEPFS